MKLILALTVAACLQVNAAGFAQTIGIRTESGSIPSGSTGNIPPASINIHGRVVDENGKSLAGAAITVKETSKETVTGSKGKFTIQADAGQTLLISDKGYDDREILISSDKELT